METWFRRDGAGIATNTGTGGVVAVPLVTKGMAEVEGSNRDMNYFLGIRQTDGVLAADFEDTATGLNHPVVGVTPIPANGVWHHAAATYDGTTWRLYLDGVLDAQLVVGAFTPRADSIQHAAIGTAFNSTGGITSGQTQGFFDGAIDEARIWNHARTLPQISRGRTHEITNAPGSAGTLGLQRRHRHDPQRQHRSRHQRDHHGDELGLGGRRALLDAGQHRACRRSRCGGDDDADAGRHRRAGQRRRRRRRRAGGDERRSCPRTARPS